MHKDIYFVHHKVIFLTNNLRNCQKVSYFAVAFVQR